jgi:hypothetical protein
MQLRMAWVGFLAMALAAGLVGKAPRGRAADVDAKKPKATGRKVGSATAALIKKLSNKMTMEKGIDPNTPFRDAMEYITEHHRINIVIDAAAFKEGAPKDAEINVEAFPVQLTKVIEPGLPIANVLRLLLAQVPREWAGGATYLVRDGYIEITSKKKAAPERLLQTKVAAAFDKRPLDEALQELADGSGVTVIVDTRVGDKAQTAVTATLKNDVSLENAVRLLADMAELKAVVVGGSLYVTTKENAALIQAEKAKKKPTAAAPEPKESGSPRNRQPRPKGDARGKFGRTP